MILLTKTGLCCVWYEFFLYVSRLTTPHSRALVRLLELFRYSVSTDVIIWASGNLWRRRGIQRERWMR